MYQSVLLLLFQICAVSCWDVRTTRAKSNDCSPVSNGRAATKEREMLCLLFSCYPLSWNVNETQNYSHILTCTVERMRFRWKRRPSSAGDNSDSKCECDCTMSLPDGQTAFLYRSVCGPSTIESVRDVLCKPTTVWVVLRSKAVTELHDLSLCAITAWLSGALDPSFSCWSVEQCDPIGSCFAAMNHFWWMGAIKDGQKKRCSYSENACNK